MAEIRKRLSFSAGERRRLLLLAGSGIELAFLECTFGRPASALEAALDDWRRAAPLAPETPMPDDAEEGETPPLPSPPLRRALETLGDRVTATIAGYALDGLPASIPDLIRAARAAGTRIRYPGIDPLPGAFAAGPSAHRPARRRAG
ncbi:MAG: hypothetical protein OXC28_18455 [Defluviicoccus sp.]|nr:hypothetical protein [Defluviicoccus sp.]